MNQANVEHLISELLRDPVKFEETGGSNKLLKEYRKGFPIETLRPLLRSDNQNIQSVAIFVAIELGVGAHALIHDVVPLLKINDQSIQFDALQSLMICSVGENVAEFVHVVSSLLSPDTGLQILAMFLISNASSEQLNAALNFYRNSNRQHTRGLLVLIEGESIAQEEILEMINNAEPLVRKYGAIAIKRLNKKNPYLLASLLSSDDLEIRRFAHDFVK